MSDMAEQKYDFLEDVYGIVSNKWEQLRVHTDEKETPENTDPLKYIRESPEYLMEFIDTISVFLENGIDYSPYVLTQRYILEHIDNFMETHDELFELMGDDMYELEEIEDSDLDAHMMMIRNSMVEMCTEEYARAYIKEMNDPGLVTDTIYTTIYWVFMMTIMIMLSMERDFVRLFE